MNMVLMAENQGTLGLETATETLSSRRELAMVDDSLERVAIETVQVGDYVFAAAPKRSFGARRVNTRLAKPNARTGRIVGWLVELGDGEVVWWPHSATVWRQCAMIATLDE
jgi:hypothetical protein